MTPLGPDSVLSVFLIFCRVGATMLLMPGISSSQIPAQVRLFLAISVALALAPLLMPAVRRVVVGSEAPGLVWMIASELLIGLMIGLLARIFFLALQALASVAATAVGFSGVPGSAIEEAEPVPALVSLITVSAVVLMFQTDLHWEVLRGLAASYSVLPPGIAFQSGFGLTQVADRLSETFYVTLRIASPFIIYAIIVNLASGIVNKLIPQVPIYFVSLPLVLAGGLILFYLNIEEILLLFNLEFAYWAHRG